MCNSWSRKRQAGLKVRGTQREKHLINFFTTCKVVEEKMQEGRLEEKWKVSRPVGDQLQLGLLGEEKKSSTNFSPPCALHEGLSRWQQVPTGGVQ